MQIIYIIYQYLVAWPLFIINTAITAITTILCARWPNSRFINTVQSCWSKSFFYLMFLPVTVTGKENVKRGQSYVFVTNHQSFCDVFLVYGWLPVVFKYMMKKELRKIPLVGWACEVCGHVYVDRSNPRAAAQSVKKMEQTLRNGVCTVIYPEGTRTTTGEVQRFKRGAFHIALDLHLPVVPLSITGCFECMPKGKAYIKHHPVHLHIGEPMDLSGFEDENEAIEAVREAVIKGMKE